MRTCPFCGARVVATMKYCPECGGRLELTEPGLPSVVREGPTDVRKAVKKRSGKTTKKRAAVKRRGG